MRPLTIREIFRLGETRYYQHLNILTIEPKRYIKLISGVSDNLIDLSTFDILTLHCSDYGQELSETKEIILSGLELFFNKNVTFIAEGRNIPNSFFYLGNVEENKFITRDNYELIKNIILKQNCFKTIEEDEEEFKPANEAAAKVAKKILAARKMRRERKKEEILTLYDLVSVLASNGNNINILNVWDLTMFQFNDQFNRMQMIEDYEININCLLHITDSSKINLKHYIRKIDK